MQSSLVTGGAGFIGSHLVEGLLARGQSVIVLDDLSTGLLDNLSVRSRSPQSASRDRRYYERGTVAELIKKADVIYHLAAVVGMRLVLEEPERAVTTNVVATAAVLHLTSVQKKPVFLASTSEVYGKNPDMPLSEDDDGVYGPSDKTRWIYAAGKAMDEITWPSACTGRPDCPWLSGVSSTRSARASWPTMAWCCLGCR